ncbi:hypothetical protein [Paenibacillus alvei]|uniref:hypothetical protein n=1 Tax=Paenibacillus alvei TaxID=44250 RepID=UPI0018CD7101|nr:hypothetical protein [Paenibacillus alvei]MCY9577935.1 hypothetical protein [Paenibacillus alvei]MCY9587498.1 hypothetical protein [Paenibacillus alvei]
MDTRVSTFDYGQLDGETAECLRKCEQEIGETLGQAATRVGAILKRAQEKLAAHGYGCFGKWLDSMGFPRRTAYELIDRYELFVRIPHNQRELFETLPTSLSKVISAKSADSTEPKRQAKQAVLNGDIRTRKEYLELVSRLESEENARKEAEARAEKAEEDYELVRDTLEAIEAQPPKVIADPTLSDRLKRYEARYGDIDGEVTERISNHTEVDGAAAHFSDDVQTFLLNYAHLTTFRATFTGISDAAYEEYRTSLDALREFVNGMERVMASTPRGKAQVIDITEYRAN